MNKPTAKIIQESQSEVMKRKMEARRKIEEMSERFADKEKFKEVWEKL